MFNRNIIICILFASFIGVQVFGQTVSKTGTTSAKFLSIGVGPRANAMGAAYTSIANDASAMYWNPAGIAMVEDNQIFFSYTNMFLDIDVNYLGLVLPAGGAGNFGINVTALNMGEMDVTTENFPEGTGEKFSAGSFAVGFSYAKFITDNFIVGANLKYIREDIFNSSAQGFAVDIGTIFTTPFYGVKFASSITNFGTKMKMEGDDLLVRFDQDEQREGNNETIDAFLGTDEFELPLRLQIGLSKDLDLFDNNRLTIAVDGNMPNDNDQWVNVGGELALLDELISFRGGYKTLFLDDSQEGLTLGLGIKYGGFGVFNIVIDYSYQELDILDSMHSFGVFLGF